MANKYIRNVLFYVTALFLFSCEKFLEERGQDEIKPTSVRDLRELMNGAAYPYTMQNDVFVDLLTDDIQANGLAVNNGIPIPAYQIPYENGLPVFEWDPQMFDGQLPFPSTSNSWKLYYEKIKGCNVVLDQLDKVSGTVVEKMLIKGEVLFLRSYYYLRLVNLYALPYTRNGVDLSGNMGVPLILSSEVSDKLPERSSIKQVYDQIEKDLLESALLLEEAAGETSYFRANKLTAWSLLTRMYLYKGTENSWEEVIHFADKVLAEKGSLIRFGNQIASNGVLQRIPVYDVVNSIEVIWVYGGKSTNNPAYFPILNTAGKAPFTVSDDLLSMYNSGNGSSDLGDLRPRLYFNASAGNQGYYYYTNKAESSAQYGPRGIRVAEIYLNRAEALTRLYLLNGDASNKTKAIQDLNYLSESRYDARGTIPTLSNSITGEALLKACLDERRKELCLENGARWFDIRRLGIPLTHISYKTDGTTQTFQLSENTPLHALPIPFDVMSANSELTQNPR